MDDPADRDGDIDDIGLFGPDSVTWRVHAEPILWFAGFRALLLQSLHPRALAGVLQNSAFREDPWGRLFRTARFYGEVVYGSTRQARVAGARVRGIHGRMRAVDPATQDHFRIDEPDLLRWIYVTATESFLHTAQRAGLGLSPAEVDRYYDEQRVVADLVGLDPATVPASAVDIEAYYASVQGDLVAGEDAKATARFLTVPTLPWGLGWTPVRPLWIGVAAYGFSLLPKWARRLYGLPGLPTTDLTATLTTRAIRSAIRTLPTRVLEGPLYRAAMERAGARPVPATRNAGASAKISRTRTAGTAKATRRSTSSPTTPMTKAPTTTPA
jgi:uncharacterized protein (DUF2236 family)